MLDDWLLPPTTIERTFRMAREKIGRPDITFHSLRATHATMLVLEGGTMRETMDDLGHTSLTVAVDSYQRVVREHHRDTVELLAYRYCFASMFVRQVRQCFSAVWADGFPRCRHRFPVM